MDYIYFSSILYSMTSIKNKKLNFFTEESLIPHKSCLFSAGLHLNKDIFSFIPKDKSIILGDSGGFQILQNKLIYDDNIRTKIFNWLENNTHYAMNLDIPPLGISFIDSFNQSFYNFKYFELKQTGKTRFIKVIHGNNTDELNKWIDNLIPLNFNGGYSLGGLVKNYNADYKIFLTICLLYQKGIFDMMKEDEIFHLLGVGTLRKLIPIFYFFHRLKNMKFRLSFDSSTIEFKSFGLRKFNLFLYPNEISLRQTDNDRIDICNCIVCKDKELSELQNNPRIMSLRVLAHNHLKYVETLKMIYKILKLDRRIIDECFVEYIDMFDLIDEILDNRENCVNILSKHKFLFKGDELPNDNVNIDDLF